MHFHVVYLLVIKKLCKGLYSFLPFCLFLLMKPRESPHSLSLVFSPPVFCYHTAVRKSMTTWRYRRRYSQRIVDKLWFNQTKSKGGQRHFVATSLNAKMSLFQNAIRISFSFFYSSAFRSVWCFLEKRMWRAVQNVQPLEANTRTAWSVYVH